MLVDAVERGAYISPYDELIALETLYADDGMTLKKVTEGTVKSDKLPSEFLRERSGLFEDERLSIVSEYIDRKLGGFSVAVNLTPGWPAKLADAARPTPLLYYRGDLSLVETRSVLVVGAREATAEGRSRARRLARELVAAGVTVVTGLARGIDTEATRAAIAAGGKVIGVIGTPIDEVFPPENATLQEEVAGEHLLISQVPFYRYSVEPFRAHRYRFPERNELMAAVSSATVIVEASDTSGTLTQARACLHQGRPLFIMRSLLDNPEVTWPNTFVGKSGVFALDDSGQVLDAIGVGHGE